MNASLLDEWISKAEEDFSTATLLVKAKKNPSIIGFHCQQAIEKYLKACLVKHGDLIPKTHDLVKLSEQVLSFDSNVRVFKLLFHALNPFSVNFRYPGEDAPMKEAREVYQYAKEIRSYFRKQLL
jgi:HEPN domain-containing protein